MAKSRIPAEQNPDDMPEDIRRQVEEAYEAGPPPAAQPSVDSPLRRVAVETEFNDPEGDPPAAEAPEDISKSRDSKPGGLKAPETKREASIADTGGREPGEQQPPSDDEKKALEGQKPVGTGDKRK